MVILVAYNFVQLVVIEICSGEEIAIINHNDKLIAFSRMVVEYQYYYFKDSNEGWKSNKDDNVKYVTLYTTYISAVW